MSPSTSRRDAGIQLISRINRWMIATAVAFAGVISVVADKSFQGHTATAATTSGTQSSSSTGSSSSSGSLEQPAQAPSSAPAAPASSPVVSGGS
ncbi:MAG TPA: hypothetical protein VMU90_13530 [Solirubrobacteraceae bacterium]|nr:hypothetical protein [Solirubrobacteraceae bacterium]